MALSNAERQARSRKKQQLKEFADSIFKEWRVLGIHSRERPQDVLTELEQAAELPSSWTDEHFTKAWNRLSELRHDFVTHEPTLENDVLEATRLTDAEFRQPALRDENWIAKEAANKDTRDLADHLHSAIRLARQTDAIPSAALLEAIERHGRAVAHEDMRPSSGRAVCLAALPNYFERPAWFVEELADWLKHRLDEPILDELVRHLSQDKEKEPEHADQPA